MSLLEAKIESLIFCSPKPIKVSDIIKAFSESENKNFTEEEIIEIEKVSEDITDSISILIKKKLDLFSSTVNNRQ